MLAALILALPLVTQLDVVVRGPGWTSPAAIRRLAATHEGRLLDTAELERDLARLRTLAVFSAVSAHTDGARVEIEATDRWSLYPVIGVRRGGGHTTSRLGVMGYVEDFVSQQLGQVAVFADGGYVAARRGAVAGLDYQGPILSAGAGVRGIPIPFARAVARIDAAFGLVPRRSFDVSFSGQQFF